MWVKWEGKLCRCCGRNKWVHYVIAVGRCGGSGWVKYVGAESMGEGGG